MTISPGRGAQGRERRGHQQADGRGEDEAAVGRVEQHLRRGQRVQPEEAGRRQEAERDEEQAPVAAARGDLAGGVGQDRGGDRRAEHQPEVAGVVLPAHVRVGSGEQDREACERERHEGGPRHDPHAVLGHERHPRARGGARECRRPRERRAPHRERVTARGCTGSGGGPATRQRSRADRAGPRGRRRRLWIPRARTPGHRLSRRLPGGRLRSRRRGGGAGGLREGVARPAALSRRVAVPAVAADDRRQRGAQPPPRRRPARGPRPARGRARRARRGQRGRIARDARAGQCAPRDAAGRPRGAGRARPRGPHLPLPARALRGGDGRRARLPAGHGQVAHLARARAPARARGHGGGGSP